MEASPVRHSSEQPNGFTCALNCSMAVFSLVSPKSANQSSDSISEYKCIVDNRQIKVVDNPYFLHISIQMILYVKKTYPKLSARYSHLLHKYDIFLAATSSSLQSTVHLIINIGLVLFG